jgi:hypothetical protein
MMLLNSNGPDDFRFLRSASLASFFRIAPESTGMATDRYELNDIDTLLVARSRFARLDTIDDVIRQLIGV